MRSNSDWTKCLSVDMKCGLTKQALSLVEGHRPEVMLKASNLML